MEVFPLMPRSSLWRWHRSGRSVEAAEQQSAVSRLLIVFFVSSILGRSPSQVEEPGESQPSLRVDTGGWGKQTRLTANGTSKMSPIKDLNLVYEALNKEDTFSQGDTIAGTITFTLTKETKVKALTVKAKGDARVHWTDGSGDDSESYHAHRRYLKLKEHVVAENEKGTVLPKGDHQFKFRFTIPQGDMPSSFKGLHGKIVYMLEAKVSRSWRMPSTVQKELKFVSKSPSHLGQVMCPQSGSMDKKMSIFSKGQVRMSATINTNVCSPGDNVAVVAKIHNSSSKKMKPKYSLQQKIVYRANASTNISDQSLCKMVGEIIAPNSEESVSCQLTVPADVIPTLHNCEILTVEYYFKVYLDISFAVDPEVVFPLVIVPSGFAALQPGGAVGPYPAGAAGPYPAGAGGPYPARAGGPYPAGSVGPYPAGAVGAPSYSDFPPPAFPIGPYPVPAGSGAYGYPAPDPTQYANISSGYNNQWPQQAAPYGFPTAASSSVQPQAPTAPPLFQQGQEPPPYMSPFSPSQDTQ
ncbi:arrestin domain-containing protein 3-like [Anarhichas minor]|uniref:arrestin domain-containing protein 3-like n=1 Tax=Anarhichas minor TaxID=65739 RepID=UPI003F735197